MQIMDDEQLHRLIEGLLSRAERLNVLYLSAAGLALVILTLKYQGKERTFKFFEIYFKLDQYWIACFVYTLAHIYLSYLFVDICHKFTALSGSAKQAALETLTISKAPFIFQDLPLMKYTGVKYQYSLTLTSPASLLIICILSTVIATIIKIKVQKWFHNVPYWFIALVLFIANFIAGEWWMIELSKALTTYNINVTCQNLIHL